MYAGATAAAPKYLCGQDHHRRDIHAMLYVLLDTPVVLQHGHLYRAIIAYATGGYIFCSVNLTVFVQYLPPCFNAHATVASSPVPIARSSLL